MSAPISLEDAWERLFALVRPLGAETVPVDQAVDRFLAADLYACRTQPADDLSAMDGFAVCGPGPWRIVGESRAGLPFANALAPGEAARISTGAACPAGTAGVVIIEDAVVNAATLTAEAPEPGRHIRRRGFDFAAGTALLNAGRLIGPAQLALARTAGHAAVEVACRPRVAVLECGDELVGDPQDCPPDRLPASNGAMVAAMARAVGADTRRVGPLSDDRAALARAIEEAADADVLVTTAGASVGEHDHVRGALEDCWAQLAFWRVAIRPGKPLLVAQRGTQLILGLPGNPASSFVTAFLFVLPLIRALQGAARRVPEPIALALGTSLPPGSNRREFQRGRFEDGRAVPLGERDSSALRSLAAADLLIDRPIRAPAAQAGAMIPCYWIGNGGMA